MLCSNPVNLTSTLSIQEYSDASFASIHILSFQLGSIIFPNDKHEYRQPLFWTSYERKQVSRSVLGSETLPFDDAFDMAYTIKNDLKAMKNL